MDCQTVLANAIGVTHPLPSIDVLLWHLCRQVALDTVDWRIDWTTDSASETDVRISPILEIR